MPEELILPDGRRLGFARFGDATGPPVLFMHGFPASRLEARLWSPAACEAGVSIIAPDRPGLGLSDFQPGRTILDWPADAAALLDALGLERASLVGGSAGCPYALACALQLRDRIDGTAIVAGLGPMTETGAVRQMGVPARLAFVLARRAPSAFRAIYGVLALLVARYPALNIHLNRATPPDRQVLEREPVRAVLDAAVRECFSQGTAGAVHELALLADPWGFDVEEMPAPVHVWHGLEDAVVPHAMGEALARRAPNAQLHLVAGEGHLSLPVRHGAEILQTLVRPD